MIDNFATNIYFENISILKENFIKITEKFIEEFDLLFKDTDKVEEDKIKLMNNFMEVFETNDFIMMSDFLLYRIKPIINNN